VDLFLVEAVQGLTAVGQYSIAVASADLVYSLPVVVGTLLFPRLARMTASLERIEYARRVAVRVAAVMTGVAAAAAIMAEPLITIMYGEEFSPAVPAFIWLLPGIAALSVHTIVMNYCAAVGMPLIVVVAPALGLGVNVVANVLFLPQFGIVGASLASTLAYMAMLLISGCYFIRQLSALRGQRQGTR
jgi:O-antigen/teichoic acid export membrane protein